MLKIRIGARGSALAMWQAERVKTLLTQSHPSIESKIVKICTSGDRDRNTPLANMGGVGVFVKELENALHDRAVEIAVHSAKDLPSALPEGFMLAAVPERGFIEDALVCRGNYILDSLPGGSTIATGSPRRRAFLKHFRPDLNFCEVRGNIGTRLRKLREGNFDAIVLAKAGLVRLGMEEVISEVLPVENCLPAPGQGFIAVETLSVFTEIIESIRTIGDPAAHACLEAERSMMRTLNAGCSSAVGGYCRYDESTGRLTMTGAVSDLAGVKIIWVEEMMEIESEALSKGTGNELGMKVAEVLLKEGAGDLLIG